jgi:hypothetical protein
MMTKQIPTIQIGELLPIPTTATGLTFHTYEKCYFCMSAKEQVKVEKSVLDSVLFLAPNTKNVFVLVSKEGRNNCGMIVFDFRIFVE